MEEGDIFKTLELVCDFHETALQKLHIILLNFPPFMPPFSAPNSFTQIKHVVSKYHIQNLNDGSSWIFYGEYFFITFTC